MELEWATRAPIYPDYLTFAVSRCCCINSSTIFIKDVYVIIYHLTAIEGWHVVAQRNVWYTFRRRVLKKASTEKSESVTRERAMHGFMPHLPCCGLSVQHGSDVQWWHHRT